MKKITLAVFVFVVFITETIPQNITFDISYPQYLNYKTIGVVQRQDSSYLLAAYQNEILKVIQINKFGLLTGENESKFVPLSFSGKEINPLCITSDSGFALISSIQNGNVDTPNVDIILSKYDKNNNLIWQKTYGDTLLDEYGMMVKQTNDKGFLFSAGHYTSSFYLQNVIIIKTDAQGDIIWEKNFEKPKIGSRNKFGLIELNDGSYVVSRGTYLYNFNQSGDSLWSANINLSINNIAPLSDGGFLICSDKKIFRLNQYGNILNQKEYGDKLMDIEEVSGNRIALVSDGQSNRYVRILDIDLNVLIEREFYNSFMAFEVDNTFDDGIIICGQNSFVTDLYPRLLKTDSLFLIKKLEFNKLETIYQEGRKYSISWKSEAIEKVDLYYSTDNGTNWIEIVKSLENSGNYTWLIPATPSSECLLKIADSASPNFYYISPSNFSIRYHNYLNYIAVNQIKMWLTNDGMGSYHPLGNVSGLFWPGGLYASIAAVFSDGLVWGGNVNGKVYVNGNAHLGGLQPGKIMPDGTADDPYKAEYVIWKINKDWASFPIENEREKLHYNLLNWPGDLGAPYDDVNLDGLYTKGIDEPKFYGDETLWFVANDLDTTISRRTYGSDPIGLEIQVTTYAYNRTDELADVVFKKYKLLNKSKNNISDMYLGYWADCDLGDANDDFVGCDSLLNLGFTYNSDNNDMEYYGFNPPAIGYLLLQGPIVRTNSLDSAFYNDGWKKGFKNLPMTSFTPFVKNSNFRDPTQGQYLGTIQFYDYLRGLDIDGNAMIDPHTNSVTNFGVPGDPVTKTGWFEGEGWPNGTDTGDRRQMITSGPFTLAASDTQEIVIAIIMARGENNLQSVKVLKDKTKAVTNFYYLGILSDVGNEKNIPNEFRLYQNYPNPFNPNTTIKYSIAEKSVVQLKLFDILGKEVATLINEEQDAGFHNYKLSIINSKLSSGVYFYQLKAGSFEATKKLVLIK